MMKKRDIIIILIVILFFSLLIFNNYRLKNQFSQKDKIEDFKYLYNVLDENYPYFEILKRKEGYDWLANKDRFIENVKNTENDIEFYHALDEIIKKLDDNHANLVKIESFNYMKKSYNDIPEKYQEEYKPWTNLINNNDSEEVYSRLESLIDVNKKNNFTKMNEEKIETRIIEDNEIGYIKIDTFSHNRWNEDQEILMEFWEKVENYPNIVIDIRENNGGSDVYWMNNIISPLINEDLSFTCYVVYKGGDYSMQFIEPWDEKIYSIEKLPNFKYDPLEDCSDLKYFTKDTRTIDPIDSINFTGNIYVLTSNTNYSSADSFSSFCKSTDFAKLVGEETRGGGMGFSPILVTLPNSGLIVQFPIDMALNPDGSTNVIEHTKPDIKTKKPLEKVISIIKNKN